MIAMMPRTKAGLASIFLACLCLSLAQAVPAPAQTTQTTGAQPVAVVAEATPIDYKAWDALAKEAEGLLSDQQTPSTQLDQTRVVIAAMRERFLAAQSTNSARIATIKTQIDSLGPAPATGQTEDPAIAKRRTDLTDELTRLQAPAIKAVDGYTQSDGIIGEIDRVLRERQTQQLTQLWPAPVNPANWPAAASALTKTFQAISQEVVKNLESEENRGVLLKNLPPVLGLLVLATLLILRGRPWIERFALGLQQRSTSRSRELWAFLASLGQIIAPTLGVWALATAIVMSGILGPLGDVVAQGLPQIGFGIFLARWLGEQAFPKVENFSSPMKRNAHTRAKGRTTTKLLGLVLGLEALRRVLLPVENMSEQAAAVLTFPIVLIAGTLLFRLGRILHHNPVSGSGSEQASFFVRLIGMTGLATMGAAVCGPLLAAVGYIAAGSGLVYPAAMSLGLIGVLVILQRLAGLIYGLILRTEDGAADALVPVLIGFTLTILAMPVFALIWGARLSDITELATRVREGFQLGATRISPTDFLMLAAVFGLGFLMTRMFQGALKSSILPKTSLDQGGKNAIVAGVGYSGIFLSALIGIKSAGIDLSGLAIVAGALSVGIGFGLQNIVSNFVSGIILLIERPVSEGDWIEVGGVQGTVRSISVRSTRIQTFDRADVIVPNADLVSGVVTNWTRFNLTGRLIVKVGVAYGTDTRKVEKILQEIADAQPLAVMNPPPTVVLAGFGADSLDFEIRVILRDVNFSVVVRSEINHEIARRFAQEGVEIPFGQRDIWLRNPEAVAQLFAPGAASKTGTDPVSGPENGAKTAQDGASGQKGIA